MRAIELNNTILVINNTTRKLAAVDLEHDIFGFEKL